MSHTHVPNDKKVAGDGITAAFAASALLMGSEVAGSPVLAWAGMFLMVAAVVVVVVGGQL